MRDYALGDGQHLLAGLALAENDFRESSAQGAVVIDVGKPKVFKRQVPKPLYGLARREITGGDLF